MHSLETLIIKLKSYREDAQFFIGEFAIKETFIGYFNLKQTKPILYSVV